MEIPILILSSAANAVTDRLKIKVNTRTSARIFFFFVSSFFVLADKPINRIYMQGGYLSIVFRLKSCLFLQGAVNILPDFSGLPVRR